MIPAQFFDIFGVIGFILLFCIGLRFIKEKKFKYYTYSLLLISLIGVIIDVYNIIANFILK